MKRWKNITKKYRKQRRLLRREYAEIRYRNPSDDKNDKLVEYTESLYKKR